MKNKRAIIVTVAIAAAAAVILGIALFLAAPLLSKKGQQQQVSEKSGAEILKTAGGDFRAKFGDVMSISTAASADNLLNEAARFDGWIDIEEAIINGEDYTQGGVLHYELSDLLNKASMSQTDSGYSDGFNMGTGIAPDTISSMVGKMDEETLEQYQKIAEKIAAYMVNAAETVVDGSIYEKQQGTVQLSIGDETIAAEAYKVTIPMSVIISSIETAIDDMFNDAEIAPYITMLKAVGVPLDADDMKKALREQLNAESIYFTMYVKDEELCGLYMDGTWYDKASENKAEYLFWNNKFGFNINADGYESGSLKLKGNGMLEPSL